MFKLDIGLPCSAECFYNEESQIKFDPPVYEQRYVTVITILELIRWGDQIKKVCSFLF